MNRTELQAKVTLAIKAIELLETACANPKMNSWDKTAIHVEELGRIKAELQTKYSPLIEQLPANKPASELSKEDRAALSAYNRYEKQIAVYEAFIARKTSYYSTIGQKGFLVPELDREVGSELPYLKKYEGDTEFIKAIRAFEQHRASYGNLKNMLQKAEPEVIRGLLEDFIKSYRTLRIAVEKERSRVQVEEAKKETLWKELNDVSIPLAREHRINLQADEPYKTLGETAAKIHAQVGNAERNHSLQEIVDELKAKCELLNQERKTKLVELNRKLEAQLEGFNYFHDNIANRLTKAGIDHDIIAPIKEKFVKEYRRENSEIDEVQFKTEKLAALTLLNEELKTTLLKEAEYICSNLIEAIEKVDNKFNGHLQALEKQLEGRSIKFSAEDLALIEKAKQDFTITVQYKGVLNSEILEGIFDNCQKKEKEFNLAWPTVVAAVQRGQQARIVELRDTLIPQQQKRFEHFYTEIQKKLAGYGLWEEHGQKFTDLLEDFNAEYTAPPPEKSSYAATIDFYQAKQNALKNQIGVLQATIIKMQEAICNAMVSTVDVIADRVEQGKREIKAQIQEDLEFNSDELALIRKMNACIVQPVAEAAIDSQSPEMLEPILKNALEKEKELQEVLPGISKAIERCKQAKIDKLKLIQSIDAVAAEIDTARKINANKIAIPGYQVLESETAFVKELSTPVTREYRQSVDQAELEKHLETLLATKAGLAAESEKTDKIVARHELVLAQKGKAQFFLTLNLLEKDEAAALLITASQHMTPQQLNRQIGSNLIFINNMPALEAIEDFVQNNGKDTLAIKDKIAFVKLLLEQKIVVKAEFFNKDNNKAAVIKLLNEKGLKDFITPALIENETLCRALLLIKQQNPTAINQELMSDKAIGISKMAVVITKLDDFVNNYEGTTAAKQQLKDYFTAAMPVLVAKNNCDAKKEELSTLAKTHFEHEHFPRRLLADVLQCITGAFLIIMPVRYLVYGTHPLFTKAETSRETHVKQAILPELDQPELDQKDDGAGAHLIENK